jgi:hypothetical protein
MKYNFNFTNKDLDFLRSKKIVRNNILKSNPIVTSKIDSYVSKYNIKFNEVVYLSINNINNEQICPNCKSVKLKFISAKSGYKKYCSRNCANKHEILKENKRKTSLGRWGVDNPAKSQSVKDKISKKNSEQSLETKMKRKETFFKKYGYETNLNIPEIRIKANKSLKTKEVIDKRKKTVLDKYNVEFPMQNEDVKNKFKNTCIDKYGTNHPMQNENVKNRFKLSCIKKYNVDNPSKVKSIISKKENNNIDKFGVKHPMILNEFKQKMINTNLKKYGVENSMLLDNFKEKALNTKRLKYKTDNQNQNEDFRKSNFNIAKDNRYVKYLGNNISLFVCDNGHQIELSSDIYSHRRSEYLCHICYPKNISNDEMDLFNFINNNYNGKVIQSYRDGLEIDIYLPDLNIGFEFNGLYYHSNKFKDKNYHIDKTNYFKEKGIRIIHIWEDDWIHKKDIIKCQIKNWLRQTPNKIYARKCVVKEIDAKTARKFLDNNHIQGKNRSVIKLGMFHKDKLVSVMTFDHFEGRKKMSDKEWNLSRFCNILDTNVVGGASKMLKYFINNYLVERIISYSDNDWSLGNVYGLLGFKNLYSTKPDYKYIIDKKRINKSRYRRSNLNTNLTESQEMESRNILKVWDCGKTKHELII